MANIKDNIKAIAEAITRESVLIHRDALIEGYRDVHRLSKFGVDRVLKKAAEYGGKKGAITLTDRYGVSTDRLDEALELLTIIAESSRIIQLFDFNIEKGEIYVEGSILVEAIGSSTKPVCGPMEGFFRGFLSQMLDREFSVKEVMCQAQGYNRCVFRVKKK